MWPMGLLLILLYGGVIVMCMYVLICFLPFTGVQAWDFKVCLFMGRRSGERGEGEGGEREDGGTYTDLPVSLFDISHVLGNKWWHYIYQITVYFRERKCR